MNKTNTGKIELMNELINLYQQIHNMHDGETKQVVETYIKKLEKHLIILISDGFNMDELLTTSVYLQRLWSALTLEKNSSYGVLAKQNHDLVNKAAEHFCKEYLREDNINIKENKEEDIYE